MELHTASNPFPTSAYFQLVSISNCVSLSNRQILMSSNNRTSAAAPNLGNMTPGFMSPRVLASPAHPTQNGGASSTRGAMNTGNTSQHGGSSVAKSPAPQQRVNAKPGTRRNTTLIGKTVRITQGPYKGYVGIVKVLYSPVIYDMCLKHYAYPLYFFI